VPALGVSFRAERVFAPPLLSIVFCPQVFPVTLFRQVIPGAVWADIPFEKSTDLGRSPEKSLVISEY
jgi:hypothetical protein